MDEAEIIEYITTTFDDVQMVTVEGNSFFFFSTERMMPFATLMTNDVNDQASDLNRPSVCRLNVGVSKDTYRSLFGPLPPPAGADGIISTDHDFTVLDELLPHPVYAPQSWVCVLNPGEKTLPQVKELLAEAYGLSVRRQVKVKSAD